MRATVILVLTSMVLLHWLSREYRSWRYRMKLRDPRWIARRERYYRTHARKCRVCGDRRHVDLNHRRYRGEPWDALDTDLEPLCRTHHRRFHGRWT